MTPIQESIMVATTELFRRGEYYWLLRPEQRDAADLIELDSKELFNTSKKAILATRRFGKDFTSVASSVAMCMSKKNKRISYISKTYKMLTKIVPELVSFITQNVLPDARPIYKRQEGLFYFPETDSQINMFGAEGGHYEGLRGQTIDRAIISEAGFCNDLQYIIDDILVPQTMTTGGDIIMITTPSLTRAHDFYEIYLDCLSRGTSIIKTLDDCTAFTDDEKAQFIEEAGGKSSSTCQREYFCEFVSDENSIVFPELSNPDMLKALVLDEPWDRPTHFNPYMGIDFGVRDPNAFVQGYYDFKAGVYIIDTSCIKNNISTDEIANTITSMNQTAYPGKDVLRYSDTDLQIIKDLGQLYRVYVQPSQKHNKHSHINHIRTLLADGVIKINPGNEDLVEQLQFCTWDDNKTKYIRTANHGHFDLVDALLYMIRNIDVYENPYPILDGRDIHTTHYTTSPDREGTNTDLEQILNL